MHENNEGLRTEKWTLISVILNSDIKSFKSQWIRSETNHKWYKFNCRKNTPSFSVKERRLVLLALLELLFSIWNYLFLYTLLVRLCVRQVFSNKPIVASESRWSPRERSASLTGGWRRLPIARPPPDPPNSLSVCLSVCLPFLF